MAKFSLKLPQMDELEALDEKQSIKKIHSYLYQLNEQLRYMMCNLDSDNLADGAVDEKALGIDIRNLIKNIKLEQDGLKGSISVTAAALHTEFMDMIGDFSQISQTATSISQAVQDAFGNYSTTEETATAISTYVTNALGDYSTTQETATAISTYVTNALGDYSTTQETATAISTYVTNALGDYSTTQQTAQAISAYVSDNTYTKVSGILITSPGIDITGNQYVRIGTYGKLIVTSGNFIIDENGNVAMTGTVYSNSGSIGGFTIQNGYIGVPSSGVYMRNDVQAGQYSLAGGLFVSNRNSNYFAFQALRDGTVIVNGYEISQGWIKDASVSGDTLTLTKYDGTTVNFNKAGSLASLELEAVSGSTSSFRANAYNSYSAVIDYAGGEIYLDESAASYSRNTWACVRPSGGSRIAYLPLSGYWDAAQAAVTPTAKTIIAIDGRITSGETYESQTGIWAAKMTVTIYYSDNTYETMANVDVNTSYLHN